MNTKGRVDADSYTSLQLLDELSKGEAVTQRDLSKRLGIALGLINSYIKNLVSKGYITIKAIPPKRYAYYLTPTGFTEKTRLTYLLLQDYTRIYREARKNIEKVFSELQEQGHKRILFAGADEVAEIAYITLHETCMELAGVVDDDGPGRLFFGREVLPVAAVSGLKYDCVIVVSYLHRERIYESLLKNGFSKRDIKMIFSVR